MTKVYRLRDKDGSLKAVLPERIALDLISSYPGTWRTAKFKDKTTAQQYVVGENAKVTFYQDHETLTLFFWEGDKVSIEDA